MPVPPVDYTLDEEKDSDVATPNEDSDSDYQPEEEIHLINYSELCDLVRDLALTKGQAELLGLRLKQFKLLAPGTLTSTFRNRHKDLVQCFDKTDNISYCKDIDSLMLSLGDLSHKVEECRLFIDSSKTSLKAVLLHNGKHTRLFPLDIPLT